MRSCDNLEGIDLEKLRKGDATGLGDRLMLHQALAQDLPLGDGSVDLVNSFLEHVENLDEVLAELARVTEPGAFCIQAAAQDAAVGRADRELRRALPIHAA